MISLIVALSESAKVIGFNGTMPWQLSVDLRRFKKLTTGHTIVMGRKTYESIGKPLPNRTNVILSRDPSFVAEGCTVVHSWEDAVKLFPEGEETFVIGGESVYAAALPEAHRLYLTSVDYHGPGDTFFPEDPWKKFEPLKPDPMLEVYGVDEKNTCPTRFMIMQRRSS